MLGGRFAVVRAWEILMRLTADTDNANRRTKTRNLYAWPVRTGR